MEIDEGAGAYILEPFAQQIIRKATEAAEQTAANAIEKDARHESRPELKVVENLMEATNTQPNRALAQAVNSRIAADAVMLNAKSRSGV